MMNRKANIEFLSQSSVVITNTYRQKTFDLDSLFAKYGQAYIDLVELKVVGVDQLGKIDRELRFLADFDRTSISVLAKPKYDDVWIRIGHAQMGQFQYWHAGQRDDAPPDEMIKAVEGTFRIKIV